MDRSLSCPTRPRFRASVRAVVGASEVEILHGAHTRCSFEFSPAEAQAVAQLMSRLERGGMTVAELRESSPEIAEQVPPLLQDLDRLRLLTESELPPLDGVCSGSQLYREVRRLADRVAARTATSELHRALVEGTATRSQLVGYALEYHWLVRAAPGLIAPALAMAHTSRERELVLGFLRSELGHDRFLANALAAVGVTPDELEAHQPLPATFALCASLGVYARQHPLSFKACLFLFERAQPAFIDAFDERCRALELPEAFYGPLRTHADLNEDYEHEDISRQLMALEAVVDPEACTVVKRHVALMVETLVQQESEIVTFYREREQVARVFG